MTAQRFGFYAVAFSTAFIIFSVLYLFMLFAGSTLFWIVLWSVEFPAFGWATVRFALLASFATSLAFCFSEHGKGYVDGECEKLAKRNSSH